MRMSAGSGGGARAPLPLVVGLLLWIGLFLDVSWGHLPSPSFKEHTVISPRLYSPRLKRAVESSHAPEEEGRHAHHLTLGYTLEDREIVLDLQLNRELIPENYFQKYHHQGEYVINRPTKEEMELCHYTGKVRGLPDSWAALSTCHGISGVVFDGLDVHHIEKVEDESLYPGLVNPHYLYNHIHAVQNRSCGFEDTKPGFEDQEADITTESFFKDPSFNRMLRHKRDISGLEESTVPSKVEVKGPWNANKRSKYVELVIVVDNRKFLENNGDIEKVYRKCKDMANIANALYAPLNIYIALVGVVVWTEYDEITLSTNGDTTLTNFLHYRRERLVKEHPNDNAQLLTGIQFNSGVVGKALKGPICTYEFSGGVSMWHSEVIGLVATTMAHEMGHNFGMEHDTENCKCPEQRCIMAPSSSTMKPYFWSSCSLEYLALAFEHGMDYCLRNKPRTLFGSPVCGNGFVEPGEECDCGLKEHCDNPCCDATTCRMFANATCATGECCDFKTCQPKTQGEVCRHSEHECDLPEYCTGQSEFCPKDIFKVDGIPCKVGQSYCYQGSCRTHSDQCRLLWGPSGKKSDNQCYEQNRKGSRHGNCGYNRLNQSYIPCTNDDVRCGMLHCSHLNERLEFGMESVAILSHSFINSGGRIIPCRTALVDLGLDDVDPGLAPEGARCGEDSLCVNQKCMPVASLKVGPLSCPNNCNGHGICNSVGQCHCDVGWAPPFCDVPGAGGSLQSGPASNPDRDRSLPTLLYIIFLGVVPLLCLIVVTVCFLKGKMRVYSKQARKEVGFLKVERRGRTSRPPSRLDTKDISGPISVETTQSLSSSPTHALLPRSATQTSDVTDEHHHQPPTTTAGSITVENETTRKPSRLFSAAGGVFGLGGFGYKKSNDQLDSAGESPPESLNDSSKGSSGGGAKSRAGNLLKSINKSISFPASFPSPNFRTSMKKQNTENLKYEVKIEPRLNDEPSPVEPTAPSLEVINVPDGQTNVKSNVAMQFLQNIAASSIAAPPPIIKPKPVYTFGASRSETNFAKPTKAQTLPPSMSLGQVPESSSSTSAVSKAETKFIVDKPKDATVSSPPAANTTTNIVPDFRNNPKLAFPHSSSFAASEAEKPAAATAVPGSKSVSSLTSKFNTPRKPSNPTSYINRNALGAQKSPTSAYSGSIKPVQSPFLRKSSIDSKPTTTLTVSPFSQAGGVTSSTKTAGSPVTTAKPLISKPAAAKPEVTKPPPAAKPTVASKPEITKPKPVEPVKTSPTKHTIWSAMDKKEEKEAKSKTLEEKENKPNEEKAKSASDTKVSKSSKIADKSASVDSKEKSPCSETGSIADKTSIADGKAGGVSKPYISRPVLQTATPNAASLIAKAPSTGVSQSSILATKEKESDPFKPPKERGRRAIFCDPITLPSPTSPNNPPIIHQPNLPNSAETVGKMITPTWSVQPTAGADQVQVFHIAGKTTTSPPSSSGGASAQGPAAAATTSADKSSSGLSKLISNVKRTPSLGVGDRAASKDKDKDKDKSSTLPRKPKAGKLDRNSLRNLEISSPVLQTEVDHKASLVPVSKSLDVPDGRALSLSPEPSRSNQPSPSNKRKAPKPPLGTDKPSPASPKKSAQNDDIKLKDKTKSRYSWRSNRSNRSADSQPETSSSSSPKVSNSDDSLDAKNADTSRNSRRPASIATSKPIRPNAPPPKPPPSRVGSEEPSPEDFFVNRQSNAAFASRATTAPLANIRETLSPSLAEPIYDTITEEAEREGSSGGGRGRGRQFDSPLGSPVLTKKSPDTLSTGSSGAEEDLMKEILKEVHVKSEGESIYSSLMRKEKKKRRKRESFGGEQ